MSEYIRRDDAVEALKTQADTMKTWVERYAEQRRGILTAVNIVEDVEPADVVPVVHARWRHYEGMYACEACGAQIDDESPFCPMCGAKMYEGDEYG